MRLYFNLSISLSAIHNPSLSETIYGTGKQKMKAQGTGIQAQCHIWQGRGGRMTWDQPETQTISLVHSALVDLRASHEVKTGQAQDQV